MFKQFDELNFKFKNDDCKLEFTNEIFVSFAILRMLESHDTEAIDLNVTKTD